MPDPPRQLNLGRYSIRAPDETTDIPVGAFWKRKQTQDDCGDESEVGETQSRSAMKKFAMAEKSCGKPSSHPNTSSFDSMSESVDTESCFSSNNLEAFIDSDSARIDDRRDALNKAFYNDRPALRTHPVETPNLNNSAENLSSEPKQDDTHESLVVDVDAKLYASTNSQASSTSNDKNSESTFDYVPYTPFSRKQKRKKAYPKQMPYDKIMSHVVFVMSGYENPRRSNLRDMACDMGARYQPNWNDKCTHLICAFKNTPKFKEVLGAPNGRIVREHWIQECSRQTQLLDWRDFKLGTYSYPDSEEEVDVDDFDYAMTKSYELNKHKRNGN